MATFTPVATPLAPLFERSPEIAAGILVIAGDRTLRTAVQRMFSGEGYIVATVAEESSALDVVRLNRFSAVILALQRNGSSAGVSAEQ